MMNRVDEIKQMWRECFPDVTQEWLDRFMEPILETGRLHVITDASGKAISSLIIMPCEMTFHNDTIKAGYLYGAATLPRYRGMGSMKALIEETLKVSRDEGYALINLIPAAEWLYDYYERVGSWSTVFYHHINNFTSVHRFPTEGFNVTTDNLPADLYEQILKFSRAAHCGTTLSGPESFNLALRDRISDGGVVSIAYDKENGDTASIAIGVPDDIYEAVYVQLALGKDHNAIIAALGGLHTAFPNKRIELWRNAKDGDSGNGDVCKLHKYGMTRIVDVERILDIVAKTAPKGWKKVVKVTDPIIQDNNHTYSLIGKKGMSIEEGSNGYNKIENFDVDVKTLNKMVFGSSVIGKLIDFPSQRPEMLLMPE